MSTSRLRCLKCGGELTLTNVQRLDVRLQISGNYVPDSFDVEHLGLACPAWLDRANGGQHDCVDYDQAQAAFEALPRLTVRTPFAPAHVYGVDRNQLDRATRLLRNS